jgi:hypothetical protein
VKTRLLELLPEWHRDSRSNGRIGFSYMCPECNGKGHRQDVWFSVPPDGDSAITASQAIRPVPHSGNDFRTITVDAHIRDGAIMHHVVDGWVYCD